MFLCFLRDCLGLHLKLMNCGLILMNFGSNDEFRIKMMNLVFQIMSFAAAPDVIWLGESDGRVSEVRFYSLFPCFYLAFP